MPRFVHLLPILLCLGACIPYTYEDGHQARKINAQGELRTDCLKANASRLDDRSQPVESIAPLVAAACTAQTEKLIVEMATADPSSRATIAAAVNKDAERRAVTYLYAQRRKDGV